jgi:hypothetical protein
MDDLKLKKLFDRLTQVMKGLNEMQQKVIVKLKDSQFHNNEFF